MYWNAQSSLMILTSLTRVLWSFVRSYQWGIQRCSTGRSHRSATQKGHCLHLSVPSNKEKEGKIYIWEWWRNRLVWHTDCDFLSLFCPLSTPSLICSLLSPTGQTQKYQFPCYICLFFLLLKGVCCVQGIKSYPIQEDSGSKLSLNLANTFLTRTPHCQNLTNQAPNWEKLPNITMVIRWD